MIEELILFKKLSIVENKKNYFWNTYTFFHLSQSIKINKHHWKTKTNLVLKSKCYNFLNKSNFNNSYFLSLKICLRVKY